jgi:hypothetical protein
MNHASFQALVQNKEREGSNLGSHLDFKERSQRLVIFSKEEQKRHFRVIFPLSKIPTFYIQDPNHSSRSCINSKHHTISHNSTNTKAVPFIIHNRVRNMKIECDV